jgi:hypothetical protein
MLTRAPPAAAARWGSVLVGPDDGLAAGTRGAAVTVEAAEAAGTAGLAVDGAGVATGDPAAH